MIYKTKKYLGIDWGEARIGLALGDDENRIATPIDTVLTIEEVLKVIKQEKIDEVVVGEPVKMSGSKLEMHKDYVGFLNLLKNELSIPIHTVDERLSSRAADALPGDKKNKAKRDAIAAMLILQSHLDKL